MNKIVYRYHSPKRKDIILFSPTEKLKEQNFQDLFIKRIIELLEETVQIKDGQVYNPLLSLSQNPCNL